MKTFFGFISGIILITFFSSFLGGCGAGIGSGGTNHNGTGGQQKTVNVLVTGGGISELSLSNGRIYYSVNSGFIYSVPAGGGEIIGHYINGFLSPGQIIAAGGKIFILNTQTAGGLISLSDSAEGATPLYSTVGYTPREIANDGTYIYCASGNSVIRTAATTTSGSTSSNIFTSNSQGIVRLAGNEGGIFVSDSKAGAVYRVNLATGGTTTLAYIGTNSSNDGYYGGLPLAATNSYLYALLNNKDILQIDKSNGSYSVVASNYMQFETIKADANALYWWQHDVSNWYLKRLDSNSGVISTIATIPFTWYYVSFYSDNVNVYWSIYDYDIHGNRTYHLQRVPTGGGIVETIISLAEDSIGDMAADQNYLYWPGNGGFNKLSKVNSTLSLIPSYTGMITLLNDDKIYFANSDGIYKVPKSGQPSPTVEWSQPLSSSSWPLAMAVDDVNIYWAVQNSANSSYPWGSFDVYSKPIAGGSIQHLSTVSDHVSKIVPYQDMLFVLKSSSSGGAISVLSKVGGTDDVIITASSVAPSDLFISNDIMYIAYDGIYACNLANGNLYALYFYGVNRLYVDNTHVYWITTGGTIGRMLLSGGQPETLYSGRAGGGITGDSKKIYWAAIWNIFSMDK